MEDDADLPAIDEPDVLRDRLRSTFADEIEENRQRMAHPKASNSVEYSTDLQDALLAGLVDELWDEWREELRAEGVDRSDFERLATLSTSTGIMWVYGDVEWEYLLEDLRGKLDRADEFLDGD